MYGVLVLAGVLLVVLLFIWGLTQLDREKKKAPEDQLAGRFARGEIGEGEYLRNMQDARLCADGTARWVEVCYCPTPLQEERPYWEEFFDFDTITDAHARSKCRDENGTEPWACCNCDCTTRLDGWLRTQGEPFKP